MTKRKLVVISAVLSAVILALFVLLIVLISGYNDNEIEAKKYDIVSIARNLNEKNAATTAKKIAVIAKSGSLKQEKNSYLEVKTAIKNGLDGILLDVSFRKDGTPVLAENFNAVTKDSPELEKIFELAQSGDFKLILNMGEVSDMAGVRKLIDKFSLKNNVMILADDEVKLAEVRRHLSGCKVCAKLQEDGFSFNDTDELRSKLLTIRQSGATYIALKPDLIDKDFVKTCNSIHMGIMVYGADTNASLQNSLSFAIDGLITDYPDDVNSIIDSLGG